MMRAMGRLALLSVIVLVACSSGDQSVLRVDLRTDYLPGLEFAEVRLVVEDRDIELTVPVAASGDYVRGERVATLDTSGMGEVVVRGTLVGPSGEVIAERRISVSLDQRSAVTFVFSRSCEALQCPLEGAPSATECQGGFCVPPECSPETPEACGPAECESAAECPAPAATCADALCIEGTCLEAAIEGRCARGEVCHPTIGCLQVEQPDAGSPPPDGGVRDGGAPDGCSAAAECDDGLFCNGVERCLEGVCLPAEMVPSCDDGIECTVDGCDEGASRCTNVASDGLCTAEPSGTCGAAGCQYPTCTPSNCAAGPCQTATCVGDFCMRMDRCGRDQTCCAGSCVAAGCNDGNACTTDSCGPSGCVNAPNSNTCSDGNACTVGDVCGGGSCRPGPARNCDDGNGCTLDSCNSSSGCASAPVAVGTICGPDVCGPYGLCRGSCSGGTQSRSCRPQACDSSGACIQGSPEFESQGCSMGDGDACTLCNECGPGGTMRCIGTCFGGCCRDGIH